MNTLSRTFEIIGLIVGGFFWHWLLGPELFWPLLVVGLVGLVLFMIVNYLVTDLFEHRRHRKIEHKRVWREDRLHEELADIDARNDEREYRAKVRMVMARARRASAARKAAARMSPAARKSAAA